MAVSGRSQVCRPQDAETVAQAMSEVQGKGGSLALRGSGCSYGDASLNSGGHLLDMTRMNRLLDFDVETGVALVEPGVTIRQLWRHAITFGYWPAVVPGTMEVSCGGAAAMNIHGKNNFALGSFGEHILSFRLLTPQGEILDCSRQENAQVFHGAIGGFGMLGCFLQLRLQLKKVYSGRLRVTAVATADLQANLAYMNEHKDSADYLVGWLDYYGKGKALGRGLIHRGDQCKAGEDPAGEKLLQPELQDVPSRIMGIYPKAWAWPGMWCVVKGGMLRFLNAAKFRAGTMEANKPPYLQTHGAFHFLLDYVPNWKKAFSPGGLIQFQPFVPANEAARVLGKLIEMSQQRGFIPYLGVLKRHRPDPFLMTHAVDGFSMAMDYAVTQGRRQRLWHLCRDMAEVVLEAGGRFYYAKDAVLQASSFGRIHGSQAEQEFRALKAQLDPQGLLQTDLSRRLLGP